MRLYHWTCDHGAQGINRDGVVRPNPHPLLSMEPLVWLTDLDAASPWNLGLTSEILSCNRMAHRFEVEHTATVMPWSAYCRIRRVPRSVRDALEIGWTPPEAAR